MGIKLQTDNSIALVRLEECVDITSAAELKRVLMDAFQSAKEVHVDLSAVSAFDVTAVQLLWAAERHARTAAAAFSIIGTDDCAATIASLQEVALHLPAHSPEATCVAEQG